MINKLSKLEKVDLKEFWKHEEHEFTPWLSEEENILLLGEAIGVDLEVIGREEKVGPYRADILCKDIISGHYVVIENQLEQTDHKHLGQIITYAAGLNAVSCVWIAKSFTEEHRAAIDWLNSISAEGHNFFAVEIILYKIQDSPLAAQFNVVAKPNDWAKSVRNRATNSPMTDIQQLQQEYWENFSIYVGEQKAPSFKTRRARAQNWYDIAIGNSNIYLSLTVDSRQKTIKIWLFIKGIDPKANFDYLYNKMYDESRSVLGDTLVWNRLDSKKSCYVELKLDADFTDKSDWEKQFNWLYSNVEKYIHLFKVEIKGLK